jgi:hypothetical protein
MRVERRQVTEIRGRTEAGSDAPSWKRPAIVEIRMDAEIGSYQEDGDPVRGPAFVEGSSQAADRASNA